MTSANVNFRNYLIRHISIVETKNKFVVKILLNQNLTAPLNYAKSQETPISLWFYSILPLLTCLPLLFTGVNFQFIACAYMCCI